MRHATTAQAKDKGCSLWYKLKDKKICLRHEAKPDITQHEDEGFSLIFDTNKAPEVTFSNDGSTKTATYYVIYAIVDHDDQQVEFRIQKICYTKNLNAEQESYSLKSLRTSTVSLS
jgi:hypothetical protein